MVSRRNFIKIEAIFVFGVEKSSFLVNYFTRQFIRTRSLFMSDRHGPRAALILLNNIGSPLFTCKMDYKRVLNNNTVLYV